jgi:hypothetical protein
VLDGACEFPVADDVCIIVSDRAEDDVHAAQKPVGNCRTDPVAAAFAHAA